jgi:hypothetical protein
MPHAAEPSPYGNFSRDLGFLHLTSFAWSPEPGRRPRSGAVPLVAIDCRQNRRTAMSQCRQRVMPLNPVTLCACGLTAAAIAMVFATSVNAATSDEAMFMRYHQAIYAASECEDLPLYQHGPGDPNGPAAQDLHVTMATVIDSRVGQSIGAGEKLSMIDQAKRDAQDLIADTGCDSPEVVDLRTLFHAELEPALPIPVVEQQ